MTGTWKLCVILAAVAGAIRGWETGSGHKYRLTTTLIFRETGPPRAGGDVGFRLTGELDVTAVWRDSADPNVVLLKFEVGYRLFFSFPFLLFVSSILDPSWLLDDGSVVDFIIVGG